MFLKDDDTSSDLSGSSSISSSEPTSFSSSTSATVPSGSDSIKTVAPTLDPTEPITDRVFVYYEGDIQYRTADVYDVPINTRGFFINNGKTCFCIKAEARDDVETWLDISSFDYGDYKYCLTYTSNMYDDYVDYTHSGKPEYGPFLSEDTFIIYLEVENCDDPIALNLELIENLDVVLEVADPANPEAPS